MTESRLERKRIGRQTAALLALLSVATAATVSAQGSPSGPQELQEVVTRGMTVWITDSTGREQKARILDASDDILTATAGEGVRRLPTHDVLRIRARRADSVINGALIGAGVAVSSGLALCRLSEPWRNCRDDVGPMLRMGVLGAAIGIGIDALIRGRRTIYEAASPPVRLHVAPIVSCEMRGVQLWFRY